MADEQLLQVIAVTQSCDGEHLIVQNFQAILGREYGTHTREQKKAPGSPGASAFNGLVEGDRYSLLY